jgi:hypothetical protein
MLINMNVQRGPKRFSDKELSKVSVQILDSVKGKLRCEQCGAEWIPIVTGYRRRLRKGYWKCPNECNVPQES